jgi:hypothetical protein
MFGGDCSPLLRGLGPKETAWQTLVKVLNTPSQACRPWFVGAPLRASRKHQQSGTHSFWTSCGTSEGKRDRSQYFQRSRVLSKTAGAGCSGLIESLHRRVRPIAVRAIGSVSVRTVGPGVEQSAPEAGHQSSSLPSHVASDRDGTCNRRLDVPERHEPPTGESLWNERQKPSR